MFADLDFNKKFDFNDMTTVALHEQTTHHTPDHAYVFGTVFPRSKTTFTSSTTDFRRRVMASLSVKSRETRVPLKLLLIFHLEQNTSTRDNTLRQQRAFLHNGAESSSNKMQFFAAGYVDTTFM